MFARTKRSKVWLYFTRIDANNSRCHKCNRSFASKCGNTSNLSKHLAKVHHIQTEKCTVFDKLARISSSGNNAPSTSSPPDNYYVNNEHGNDLRRVVNIIQLFGCVNNHKSSLKYIVRASSQLSFSSEDILLPEQCFGGRPKCRADKYSLALFVLCFLFL